MIWKSSVKRRVYEVLYIIVYTSTFSPLKMFFFILKILNKKNKYDTHSYFVFKYKKIYKIRNVLPDIEIYICD